MAENRTLAADNLQEINALAEEIARRTAAVRNRFFLHGRQGEHIPGEEMLGLAWEVRSGRISLWVAVRRASKFYREVGYAAARESDYEDYTLEDIIIDAARKAKTGSDVPMSRAQDRLGGLTWDEAEAREAWAAKIAAACVKAGTDRQVILFRLQGFSRREIAAKLGLTERAIGKSLDRTRARVERAIQLFPYSPERDRAPREQATPAQPAPAPVVAANNGQLGWDLGVGGGAA